VVGEERPVVEQGGREFVEGGFALGSRKILTAPRTESALAPAAAFRRAEFSPVFTGILAGCAMTLRRYRNVLTSPAKSPDRYRGMSTPPSSMQNSSSWARQIAVAAVEAHGMRVSMSWIALS